MLRQGPNQYIEHNKIVAELLLALNPYGRFWKQNTGGAKTPSGDWITYGFVGAADITGLIRGSGKRCEIEVKTGKGIQSKDQALFQKMIEDMGGIYILCRAVQSTVDIIQALAKK